MMAAPVTTLLALCFALLLLPFSTMAAVLLGMYLASVVGLRFNIRVMHDHCPAPADGVPIMQASLVDHLGGKG